MRWSYSAPDTSRSNILISRQNAEKKKLQAVRTYTSAESTIFSRFLKYCIFLLFNYREFQVAKIIGRFPRAVGNAHLRDLNHFRCNAAGHCSDWTFERSLRMRTREQILTYHLSHVRNQHMYIYTWRRGRNKTPRTRAQHAEMHSVISHDVITLGRIFIQNVRKIIEKFIVKKKRTSEESS